MGLDQYLGAYHKAKLEQTVFNTEESEKLREWDNDYSIFAECPNVFKDIATEIKVVNQYYNMKKISDDFANGEELTIGGWGRGNIFFRNYQKDIKLDLDATMIYKDYLIPKEETAYIIEGNYEVAYWRKANQIRQWFVNHINEFQDSDNCGYYKVTRDLLEELVKDCKTVLINHHLAKSIMPTSSGFYFGDTEYNDWYFEMLEDTIKICKKVISETNWETELVVYHESW